jgi:hypothetical protein
MPSKQMEQTLRSRTATSREAGELRITVIFTDAQYTLAALRTAGALAHDLGTNIALIAPQAVPLGYPLDHPPVSAGFTRKLLRDLACKVADDSVKVSVNLCLCRDRLKTALHLLPPDALVVVGGRKSWWPTAESRLVRELRTNGHQVLFVN